LEFSTFNCKSLPLLKLCCCCCCSSPSFSDLGGAFLFFIFMYAFFLRFDRPLLSACPSFSSPSFSFVTKHGQNSFLIFPHSEPSTQPRHKASTASKIVTHKAVVFGPSSGGHKSSEPHSSIHSPVSLAHRPFVQRQLPSTQVAFLRVSHGT